MAVKIKYNIVELGEGAFRATPMVRKFFVIKFNMFPTVTHLLFCTFEAIYNTHKLRHQRVLYQITTVSRDN